MRRTFYLGAFITIFFLGLGKAKAQDFFLTQGFASPLSLNPALTGITGGYRTSLFCENYDLSYGRSTTTGISYDQYVPKIRSGLGIQYIYDKKNEELQFQHFEVTNSTTFTIKKDFLIKTALNVSYVISRWNCPVSGTIIQDPYGHIIFIHNAPPEEIWLLRKYYLNLGAGILIAKKNHIIGFAIDHFNRPDIGFICLHRIPISYTLHWSSQFNLGKMALLSPNIIFQSQGNTGHLQLSMHSRIKYLVAGTGATFNTFRGRWDKIYGLLGLQIKWVNLQYSANFDVTVHFANHVPSHQISLYCKFQRKEKTVTFPTQEINGF